MKIITKLVSGLALLTLLTGCSIKGSEPNDNTKPDQSQDSGSYDGQGGEQNPEHSEEQGGDPSLPTVSNSITVEDLAVGYGWENATKYSSFKIDTKITVSSEGKENTGKYYESDETYRLYGAEGAKLIFQAPEGEYIRGITLTFKVKNSGAFVEGLQTGVKKAFNANKVTLSVKTGHILITEFEVEYTGEKGNDPFYRDSWTADELALINEYAYGIDIPYYFMTGNNLKLYQEDEESEPLLSNYGAEATVAEMAPYAELFRNSDTWEELSEDTDVNDLYFEAKKETANGDRYIRAHMYVCDYFGYMVEDEEEVGYFNLDLEDPYFYSWPADVAEYLAQLVGSSSTIPALANATRIEILATDEEQYLISSYNHTEAHFNAYLELLGSTYTVTDGEDELDGFKVAIPKSLDDIELWLLFDADEGAIYIYVNKHLPHLYEFPQTQVRSRNGDNFIPVPEGASYFTYEEELEQDYDYDTGEVVDVFSQAIVTSYGINGEELETYIDTGFTVGNWEITLIGVDDQTNPTLKAYIAQLFKNDETYYEFTMVYDIAGEALQMNIYEMDGYKFSTSYPESVINAFLTANELGNIPSLALAGITHYVYLTDENYVWVYTQGDFEEAWLDILEEAGYSIPETPTDYGYECRNADNTIEIDILYDENYGQTGFTIYSTEYLDSEGDWGDIDWDSLFGD